MKEAPWFSSPPSRRVCARARAHRLNPPLNRHMRRHAHRRAQINFDVASRIMRESDAYSVRSQGGGVANRTGSKRLRMENYKTIRENDETIRGTTNETEETVRTNLYQCIRNSSG